MDLSVTYLLTCLLTHVAIFPYASARSRSSSRVRKYESIPRGKCLIKLTRLLARIEPNDLMIVKMNEN